MKDRLVLFCLLVGVALVYISSLASAAVYKCGDCQSCTLAIANSSAGDTVQLIKSIINYSIGDCVRFGGKDSITFDCMGNTISGPWSGNFSEYPPVFAGILLNRSEGGSNNNYIRNCIITNFAYGVRIEFSSNNTLYAVAANINQQYAVYLYSSDNNRIASSTFNWRNADGVFIFNSSGNNISGTSFNYNHDGIWILYGSGNTITDSDFNFNGYSIHITGSDNNMVKNCHVENSIDQGIAIIYESYEQRYSRNNTFYNNYLSNYLNVYSNSPQNQNNWNITQDCTKASIIGGPCIGGNFWSGNSTTGNYSDMCLDSNGDGICNSAYIPAINNTDNLPLARLSDSLPPSIVTGLTATDVSKWQVLLGWSPAGDNFGVVGYLVYRDGIPVASTPNTYFLDYGLVPDTTYTYRVSAYDASRNQGSLSSPVSVTTDFVIDSVSPNITENLQGFSVSISQINLTWSDAMDNIGVVGYNIFRDGVWVDWTANTFYQDSGLLPQTTYNYTVSAFDADFNAGSMSLPVSVTTQTGTCVHKSDTNCNGCVSTAELTAFINRWYISNQDVTIKELMEAIGYWKAGAGCL